VHVQKLWIILSTEIHFQHFIITHVLKCHISTSSPKSAIVIIVLNDVDLTSKHRNCLS